MFVNTPLLSYDGTTYDQVRCHGGSARMPKKNQSTDQDSESTEQAPLPRHHALVEFLISEEKKRGGSEREFERQIGLPHPSWRRLKYFVDSPDLTTYDTISQHFPLPLPRVLELAGYDLRINAGTPVSERLATLLKHEPRLRSVAPLIARLPEEDQAATLTYLEYDLGLV